MVPYITPPTANIDVLSVIDDVAVAVAGWNIIRRGAGMVEQQQPSKREVALAAADDEAAEPEAKKMKSVGGVSGCSQGVLSVKEDGKSYYKCKMIGCVKVR